MNGACQLVWCKGTAGFLDVGADAVGVGDRELHLDTHASGDAGYAAVDDRLADELTEEITAAARVLLPIEAVHTTTSTVTFPVGQRIVRRGEASLVAAHASTLPDDVPFGRHSTSAGVTDLEVEHPEGNELIEGKITPARKYVRQALAQLLHYAPATPRRPAIVSALFPRAPEKADVALHRYGIDCIYMEGPRAYRRESAPDVARDRLRQFWT